MKLIYNLIINWINSSLNLIKRIIHITQKVIITNFNFLKISKDYIVNKKLIVLSIMVFFNLALFSIMKISLGEQVVLIWKFNPSYIVGFLILYIALTILLAYSLKVLFRVKEKNIYNASCIFGIIFGLGISITTIIKSLRNISDKRDILFENSFISLQYIFTKLELKNSINDIYIRNFGKYGPLSEDLQNSLVEKCKTMEELKSIIIKMIELEKSPEIKLNIFSYISNLFVNHPILMTSLTVASLIGIGFTGYYTFNFISLVKELKVENETLHRIIQNAETRTMILFKYLDVNKLFANPTLVYHQMTGILDEFKEISESFVKI